MSDLEGLDEILSDLVIESLDGLDQVDRDLIALEKDPGSTETLSSIFRTVHSIKGASGFLTLTKLESLAHAGESLLSLLRDRKIDTSPDTITILLRMVDALRDILTHLDKEGTEGPNDYSELKETLLALVDSTSPMADQGTEETRSSQSFPSGKSSPDTVEAAGNQEESSSSMEVPPSNEGSEKSPGSTTDETGLPQNPSAPAQPLPGSVADSTIRVDVATLDRLMNLVGELVLARNQILQFTSSLEDTDFLATSQHLNLVTTELQEGVMKTRMQPIGNVWNKFPRIVRDLATSCGKKVRILMEGRETELDKTILESIKDPLTHAIRNSVDHGIETPKDRKSLGKPEEGTITLRAFHEGGQVNIEISDDGAGLDLDKIKEKALSRGLVTPDQLLTMSERQIIHLIMKPGFSTAEKVTNVSGRGVGMDVVRTSIEKIGGTLDIQSAKGEGTVLKIKIPLTLAIIPALIVTSKGDRFAIPQVSLVELVRIEAEKVKEEIETIHGCSVYRLRGNLLPLVDLDQQLLRGSSGSFVDHLEEVHIVVLQADDRQFGLIVENILDTEEIVVKPLGKQIKSVTAFAGAAIMGDGKVALILDVLGIAHQAGVISDEGDAEIIEHPEVLPNASSREVDPLLLVSCDNGARAAIPLSSVSRLEEIQRSSIEHALGKDVIQYRGNIVPLIPLSDFTTGPRNRPEENPDDQLNLVVVHTNSGEPLALVVEEILDIVDDSGPLTNKGKRPGIKGVSVILGTVTEVIEIEDLRPAMASSTMSDDCIA